MNGEGQNPPNPPESQANAADAPEPGNARYPQPGQNGANGQYGGGWNLTSEGPAANAKGVTGLFYDASLGSRQLVAQAIGALVLCTVMFGVAFLFFKLQNAFMKGGIRPEADIEMIGLDMPEMGALAYPDFMEQDAVTMHAGTSPTHEVSAPV